MGKRFLLYIDGYTKPIAITDPNENRNIDELSRVVTEMITGVEMCNFSTENDSVIVKPSHIKAVYIANILSSSSNKPAFNKRDDIILDFGDIEQDESKDSDDIEEQFSYKEEEKPPRKSTSTDTTFFESGSVLSSDVLEQISNTQVEPKRKGRPKKQDAPKPAQAEPQQTTNSESSPTPIIHETRYVPLRENQ